VGHQLFVPAFGSAGVVADPARAQRQSSTLLLHSRVDKLVVCNPRKNALLKDAANARSDSKTR
jgi:hypothetical protein